MTQHVLTVVATDVFGETSTETLLVEYSPPFPYVKLRPREGPVLLIAVNELREAISE